jgi:hypothetical protein
MVWALASLYMDRKRLVAILLDVADLAKESRGADGDEAVRAVRAWCRGEASLDEVRAAAAYAAYAADAVVEAADAAAYAVVDAVAAAYAAYAVVAAVAAADAVVAAAAAADAVVAAAAAADAVVAASLAEADAGRRVLRQAAEIARAAVTWQEVEELLARAEED